MLIEDAAKGRVIAALENIARDYAELSDDDRQTLRLVFSRWYGAWEFPEACRVAADTMQARPSDAG